MNNSTAVFIQVEYASVREMLDVLFNDEFKAGLALQVQKI